MKRNRALADTFHIIFIVVESLVRISHHPFQILVQMNNDEEIYTKWQGYLKEGKM